MRTTTRNAIAAILAGDDTIPRNRAENAIRLLDGGDVAPRPVGRILRTTEAARICGVTTKTLRAWTRAGALVPVYVPGAKLRTGYTEESVRALVAGRKA